MYKQIRKHQVSAPKLYHQRLVQEKLVKEDEYERIAKHEEKHLADQFSDKDNVKKTMEQLKDPHYKGAKSMQGKWNEMTFSQYGKEEETGIDLETIPTYINASIFAPTTFQIHPRIQKYHIQNRLNLLEKNSLDFAAAEAVAFASLIDTGYNVRLSGQDVERATFSHRHLVFTDI
mmetsp:Transcript_16854/g.14752  ORF Transcript_16854/g.14752 Transcript_16854/m.14752 type:complete len:175 (-) Transcript_16854:186-710(-)